MTTIGTGLVRYHLLWVSLVQWTGLLTLSLGLWAGLPHSYPPTLLHHQALVPETSHQPCKMFLCVSAEAA